MGSETRTELIFDTKEMTLTAWQGKGRPEDPVAYTPGRAEFRALAFVDSHGRAWERTSTDLYVQQPLADADVRGYVDMDEPRVAKPDVCEGEGK
ncbi:hypothetical protein [Streptomyces cupreus]|uniref:Uncharacterized protein n=1 Tax=Streptomyces cupreus TaxID=2759956 RepID=A0A7X1J8M8_9ACTN|nr:hypothetical protein [Streptomyces cupreus]MBC2906210.1 hypothetical protein [Streptomyces cupreus]